MLIDEFSDEFRPKLENTPRWVPFRFIAQYLLGLGKPLRIVETGTLREIDDWSGDGQSTRLWDWMVDRTGGRGDSVDIEPSAVKVAASICKKMKITQGDSIEFLRKLDSPEEIDFLYLDSYDCAGPLSPLHHVGELAAIYERLKPGCLIAVDDCHTPEWGKQILVKRFFELARIAPLGESWITVWQKPT